MNRSTYIRFSDFSGAFLDRPVIGTAEIHLHFPELSRRTLSSWISKGLLHRIRNGFYRLGSRPMNEHERWAIANASYSPSYIGVRSALGFYGFIPEGVFHVESVTTLPTRRFQYANTWYSFRSVRPAFFFGYRFIEHEGQPVMMATPEKTILDLLYLHADVDKEVDFEAWRFDEVGILKVLDQQRIQDYLTAFGSPTLHQRYRRFNKWLHDRD